MESALRSCYNLKQLVNFPTHGNNTLDIVLTNLSTYYDKPTKCAPFGLSDQVTIETRSIKRSQVQGTSTASVKVRDLRPSSRFAVRKYIEMVDIPTLLDTDHSCKEKTSLFQTIINNGMDSIMPLRNKTVRLN
jgi:hypothetical protein